MPYKLNRRNFIDWSNGLLLERDKEANVRCLDQKLYEKAQEALDKGEVVYLCVNGKVVTQMKLEEGVYVERRVEENDHESL